MKHELVKQEVCTKFSRKT